MNIVQVELPFRILVCLARRLLAKAARLKLDLSLSFTLLALLILRVLTLDFTKASQLFCLILQLLLLLAPLSSLLKSDRLAILLLLPALRLDSTVNAKFTAFELHAFFVFQGLLHLVLL